MKNLLIILSTVLIIGGAKAHEFTYESGFGEMRHYQQHCIGAFGQYRLTVDEDLTRQHGRVVVKESCWGELGQFEEGRDFLMSDPRITHGVLDWDAGARAIWGEAR